jgi:hypothetical protein
MLSKQETSSPTVATEALSLTCVIDAIEGRDVATCDIPGAFMQSDMKGKVVMKLEGVMAEIIIKIDPKQYKKFVATENGKDVIYVIMRSESGKLIQINGYAMPLELTSKKYSKCRVRIYLQTLGSCFATALEWISLINN